MSRSDRMTMEEAVSCIKTLLCGASCDIALDSVFEKYREAVDMAIEALTTKPASYQQVKTDLISRADAIEAVEDVDTRELISCNEAVKALRSLPSADAVPKHDVEIIIDEITKRTKSAEAVPHGRLIDADALMEYCSNQKTKTISNNDIARFPTVQAEAVQGWIPLSHDGMGTDFPYWRDGEWVIVTDGEKISVERIKKDAYDHFYPNGRWFELDEVVAWMPLPEPYKGGDTK